MAWRSEWLAGLALVAMTLVAYERVRHAGFIWDDEMHVTANPTIVGPLGLGDIWTSRAARYFPLTLTTFWLEYALWGLNALPYHVVNVLMHGACAVALWRVLKSLSVRGAWLGAALWALHPVQAETVAWITELKNTQSCLFYLLAVLFYVKWLEPAASGTQGRRPWCYALALACAGMAMASKSSTVVLPVVLCLCAWWINGRWRWRSLVALSPVFLMSLASSALSLWTQHFEGANDPEWSRSLPERIAVAGRVAWFYIGKLLWPSPLIFIYPRWHIDWTHAASFLPTAAACGGLFFLWWNRDGRLRPVFFAFAYFLAALIPVLGLADQFFWRYSFVGDHFQYLASMGPLALAAAAITTALAIPWKGRPVLAPLLWATLLSVLGVMTARECPKYHDSETLWRSTLAENPGAWMAHNNLGAELTHAGRMDEAVAQFQMSLELQPDNVSAHNNLGDDLLQLGRADEALAHYHRALEIDPNFVPAQTGLGGALVQLGRVDEAIPHLQRALAADPGYARAHVSLGTAYLQEGRTDEAVAQFNEALRTDPGNAATITDLGTAFVQKGQPEQALAQYQRALRIDPSFATALLDLGNVLQQEGRLDEAIDHYQRALRADPNSAVAHNNLGYALLQKGRLDEAIAHCRRALEIRPGYPEARRNLGAALLEKRRADALPQEASPRR
ncbi:MAG TPA: tetratricopeptide repeat protein [Opitutaceae bacterium]|nr:tetratricopeptide repeat protein [Opitutaceae bacterium]